VERRASKKSFQALRSPAFPLTSFDDLPVFLTSSSIVLRHILFGIPLLLYPWRFQSNAVFSIAPASLYNVCPIYPIPFSSFYLNFCWFLVILHSSSFVILSAHFIFIVRLKHLFVNVCKLLVIWLVVFQVSQAYNNADFTFVLNIHILTPLDMSRFLHTGYSWTNMPFAFLILLATSSSVPPFTDTTLPKYIKSLEHMFVYFYRILLHTSFCLVNGTKGSGSEYSCWWFSDHCL
jgi:hypothetical protein